MPFTTYKHPKYPKSITLLTHKKLLQQSRYFSADTLNAFFAECRGQCTNALRYFARLGGTDGGIFGAGCVYLKGRSCESGRQME